MKYYRLARISILGTLIILMVFTVADIVEPPIVTAANRCGTIWAGKLQNNTSHNIRILGDRQDGTVVEIILSPGQSGLSRGVCDVDFFWVPSTTGILWLENGWQTYYPGQQVKVGARNLNCFNYGYPDQIMCNSGG